MKLCAVIENTILSDMSQSIPIISGINVYKIYFLCLGIMQPTKCQHNAKCLMRLTLHIQVFMFLFTDVLTIKKFE